MLVSEAQVLEFGFYLVQSETVCQRCVYVESLSGNLVLLVCRLAGKGSHVVQTVAYLYQNHPYVVAHRQKQFLEVLCLSRRLFAEYASGYLRQSIDNLRNLAAEDVFYILNRIVCVFDDVVEQSRADACRSETHFLARYLCHGNGVHDVWLTRQSAHAFVRLPCKVECLCDDVNFFTVTCCQIRVEQMLERIVYHLSLGGFLLLVFKIQVVHDYSFLGD